MNKGFLLFVWSIMLLPVISGLVLHKRLNKALKGFVLFVLFSLIVDISNHYIGVYYNNNLWVFKVFLICELAFFAWFYNIIFEKPMWKIEINLLFVLCLTFVELLSFVNTRINDYASWFHVVFFIFFIVQSAYAVIYSFRTFETNIFHNPVFWISFGRLFYYILISFIYIYPEFNYKYLYSQKDIILISSILNLFANVCLYTLFSISILCLKNQK